MPILKQAVIISKLIEIEFDKFDGSISAAFKFFDFYFFFIDWRNLDSLKMLTVLLLITAITLELDIIIVLLVAPNPLPLLS